MCALVLFRFLSCPSVRPPIWAGPDWAGLMFFLHMGDSIFDLVSFCLFHISCFAYSTFHVYGLMQFLHIPRFIFASIFDILNLQWQIPCQVPVPVQVLSQAINVRMGRIHPKMSDVVCLAHFIKCLEKCCAPPKRIWVTQGSPLVIF